MRTSFVIVATDGTYTSPTYQNVNSLKNFNNVVSFVFYNDYTDGVLSDPSTDVSGTITVNGTPALNGEWQNIPNSVDPSTVDASNPLSLQFVGVVYQLQIITSGMTNTNYIEVILDTSQSI
jgi:hypothetical protein